MCQALTQSARRPEIPPFSGKGLTGRFLPRKADDFQPCSDFRRHGVRFIPPPYPRIGRQLSESSKQGEHHDNKECTPHRTG